LEREVKFRLTEQQEKILTIVEAQFRPAPTSQLRWFWKRLRAAVLPPVPTRRRNQTALEYALTQTRWQRIAALSVESHVAAAQLLRQEIELEMQLTPAVIAETPEQQNDALRAQVRTAPKSLRWDILQDILADNPDWVGDDTPDNVVPING
jgi:hypothetical protein